MHTSGDSTGDSTGDFRLRISLQGSVVSVSCVVYKHGFCVSNQHNLLEGCCKKILIQLWTKVVDFSLPGLRINISHLSILGRVIHGRYYVSHCFGFSLFFLFVCLLFLFLFQYLFLIVKYFYCHLSDWRLYTVYDYVYYAIYRGWLIFNFLTFFCFSLYMEDFATTIFYLIVLLNLPFVLSNFLKLM